MLENQRKYELDIMEIEIRRKIIEDQKMMEKVALEKNIKLMNKEEETKRIIAHMLKHLRTIKSLKQEIQQLEAKKNEGN
jgi:hypothetical protein